MEQLDHMLEGPIRKALRSIDEVEATTRALSLGERSTIIRDHVTDALTHSGPSTEEVAAAIKNNNGFLRVGSADGAVIYIDDQAYWCTPGTLIDALMHLQREET